MLLSRGMLFTGFRVNWRERGRPITLHMYWHQPLTTAVKQTSKHALNQTAHSLFPHPIPEPFMLSTQWKSKHTRKIFPCKCENHTGKKKNTQFKIHHAPKENNTLWSACAAGLTTSRLSIMLPAVYQLDKYWRIWPLHPSWTQTNLWIVVSLGSQIKL